MVDSVSQEEIDRFAATLSKRLQSLIEESGLSGYEIESITLKEKPDVQVMGLLPGCELKCSVGGFPPKVDCRVVCG
ncbi:hypothetical protein [Consotaella aegiceratis]|uniref:hypothetical protein n=1 Tax=Consotaella aegiceratis TaxID=3097961 RepID=UPI002F4045F3